MSTTINHRSFHGVAWLIITGAILFAIGFSNQIAHAGEAAWSGRVTTIPSSGLIGEWVVAERTFITNSATEFRQDKGSFAINGCVEVEYNGTSSPYQATKIASKNSDDCSQGATPSASPKTGTPQATTTPSTTGTAQATPSTTGTPQTTPSPTGDEQEAYGRLESRPSPGFIGTWIVNGIAYNAPASAEFKQEEGALSVGACVKIHFSGSSAPFTIREIETEISSHCAGGSSTPDSTPGSTATATNTPVGESEVYGRVESMPAGLNGTWVVNGIAYNAANGSEFKQEEHGAFAIGVCVKIHYSGNSAPFTVREIETESSARCAGSSSTPDTTPGATPSATPNAGEAEIYGILESFPSGLIGTWNIGGMSFAANSNTEFSQSNGAFAVGMTVKVHFSVDVNGINQAREIETKFANDSDGSDDDGNGSFEGSEGHAYGTIDSFPAGLQGEWSIGGILYQTTEASRFAQNDGAFAVGGRVKVEYFLDSNGNHILQKVESTSDNGSSSNASHFKIVGFVNQMPANGLVGAWVVNNSAFEATSSSKFKENNGLLGIGAYVSVEYSVQNGKNQIHEIETYVPAGAGNNTVYGKIDDKVGAISAASVQAGVWVINGVNYTITPATDLNDLQGELAVGKTVLINSTTAADGSQVATQVRGILLDQQVFLPLTSR